MAGQTFRQWLDPILREAELRIWIEVELRRAIHDPEIILAAIAMLKVAHEAGDPPDVMMRKILADFVFNAFKIDMTEYRGSLHGRPQGRGGLAPARGDPGSAKTDI